MTKLVKAFFGVNLRRNDSIFKGTFFEGCPFKFRLLTTPIYNKTVKADGAMYLPFQIKWKYDHPPVTFTEFDNLVPLTHDVMHALDHFIKGRKDRLLKPDFGLGLTKSSFTYPQWKAEANVIAMQYAALSLNRDWGCVQEHSISVMNRVLSFVENPSPHAYMLSKDKVDAVKHDLLDYWKDNYSMMHSKYKEMIDWINTTRRLRQHE